MTTRVGHAFLVVLFTCLGSLPQLALCLDAAGHRAIELTDASCCRPTTLPRAAKTVQAHDPGCAPDCRDIPLGVIAAAQTHDQSGHVMPLHYTPSTLSARLIEPPMRLINTRASLYDPPPRASHTTIYLC